MKIEHLLSCSSLFRKLPLDQIRRIEPLAQLQCMEPGDVVFDEGQIADHFYIVGQGAVQLELHSHSDSPRLVNVLRAPESFGLASALHLGRYPARATTLPPRTCVVAVETAGFRKLLTEQPTISNAIIAGLCTRVFGLIQRVDEMSGDAATRLARHLLQLPTADVQGQEIVKLGESKSDLARWLDINPATLSRVLNRWRHLHWVNVHGRRIEILNPEAIEAEANT
ncbi:MAG: Crp/Fnr family transcriptional regulator [Planctomycetota bacterium]